MGRLQFCLKLLAYWIFDTFFSTICRREYSEKARCKRKTTQTGRQAMQSGLQYISSTYTKVLLIVWFQAESLLTLPVCSFNGSLLLPSILLLTLWLTKTLMQSNLLQTDSKYSINTLPRSRVGNSEVPIYNSCTNLAYKVFINKAESSKGCTLDGKENPCAGESAVLQFLQEIK